jgi:glyoxylase-like metal-dependent hydrolase (beta-lactamase superfamily II)
METNEQGLTIVARELGPAQTNAYLISDGVSGTAVAIDPAWDGVWLAAEAERRGWRVTDIWLTHAHFDHFGGAQLPIGAAPSGGASPGRLPTVESPRRSSLVRIL